MRKNAIRRITAFSLALLLLMLPLCSCNQSADTTDTTVSTIATVDDKNDNWSHVPDVDLGGRTFNILRGRAVVPEAYNGEPINDTMYECVLYINDRFNVDIVSVASSTESASDDMLAAQMAGLTAYDLVYPHPTIGIQAFLTTGLLTNLKENQYISLNGPWYNQSFVNNYTTNGKL